MIFHDFGQVHARKLHQKYFPLPGYLSNAVIGFGDEISVRIFYIQQFKLSICMNMLSFGRNERSSTQSFDKRILCILLSKVYSFVKVIYESAIRIFALLD